MNVATAGLPLYRRRVAVATRTGRGAVGQIATPMLWILVVAPALDTALGGFDPDIDYFTWIAVSEVAFLASFTAMFSGINVIVDTERGISRSLSVAPVSHAAVTVANALGVLTIALAQAAFVVGLAVLRGAELRTSAAGATWVIASASLLTLGVYGMAEVLARRVGRLDAFGPLIPAIGVTPWLVSGSLFPISVLPPIVEHLALLNPWTHAVAVLRHGLMEGTDPGLADIWHLGSATAMAVLSTTVLAVFAAVTLGLAVRAHDRVKTA